MNDRLLSTLKQLRLSGLAASLDIRLAEAASHQLNHAEFLELILQDELLVRYTGGDVAGRCLLGRTRTDDEQAAGEPRHRESSV